MTSKHALWQPLLLCTHEHPILHAEAADTLCSCMHLWRYLAAWSSMGSTPSSGTAWLAMTTALCVLQPLSACRCLPGSRLAGWPQPQVC